MPIKDTSVFPLGIIKLGTGEYNSLMGGVSSIII